MYSQACKRVKINPRIIVINKEMKASLNFLFIILWWDQVTVAPDANRIEVFNKGTWNGLKGVTAVGGHEEPNSIVGLRLEWKKAQKKEKKKRTSDVINKIIPHLSLNVTFDVCRPWKDASRWMSRHHCNIVNKIIEMARFNIRIVLKWKKLIILDIRIKAPIEPVNGQGLFSTIWKVWNDINLLLLSIKKSR